MGWKIVAHGLSLLFRNPGEALRVSVGPLVIAALLVWLAFRVTGASPQMLLYGLAVGRLAPQAAVAISIVLVVVLFSTAWVAVAWHRFILLEEYPGLLPALPGGRIAAYAGRSILLAILMVVVMFPVWAIAGQIVMLSGLGGVPGAGLVLGFALDTLFTFLWLRIAIVLPATALGRPYSLSRGWNDGARLSGEVLRAAAIVVALNLVATRALALLPLGAGPALVAQALLTWITLMAGSSLLTTLYGHLAEGRRLP